MVHHNVRTVLTRTAQATIGTGFALVAYQIIAAIVSLSA